MHNFKTSCCFTTFIVACILSSCSEEATTDILTSNDEIGFAAVYGDNNDFTRGAVIDEDKLESFNVSAYAYALDESKTWDDYFDTSSSPNFIKNEKVTGSKGTIWHTASNHYWPNTNMRMRFFGFANFDETDKDHFNFSHSYTQITYTVPTEAKDQRDIIAAVSDVKTAEYRTEKKSVPMHFHHIFTGIRFATSSEVIKVDGVEYKNTIDKYKIQKIEVKNVYSTGTFTLKDFIYTTGKDYDEEKNLDFFKNRDNMWSDVKNPNSTGYSLNFDVKLKPDYDITNGVEIKRNDKGEEMSITYGPNTMMMIPQSFTKNPEAVIIFTLTDQNGKALDPIKITLGTSDWGMGQMITYRLYARDTSSNTSEPTDFGLTYEVCPWSTYETTIPDFE